MTDLKTLDQYNELQSQITKIVNDIDPCFYSGPADEYDSHINNLIRLIRDHQINNDNFTDKLKEVFFGSNEPQGTESEKLSKLSSDLKPILAEWI